MVSQKVVNIIHIVFERVLEKDNAITGCNHKLHKLKHSVLVREFG